MNHCLLEITVKVAPTIRYTQDNKTAIAEMEVTFEGLRAEDPEHSIKAVGWGNVAQELQNQIQVGQKVGQYLKSSELKTMFAVLLCSVSIAIAYDTFFKEGTKSFNENK